jgi:hypothetical protein
MTAKKLLPLLLLLMPCAARAQFPYIPVVQSANNFNGNACAFNNPVTAGDRIIVSQNWETSTSTPSVTDTLSTSYSQLLINTSNSVRTAIYLGTASSSGSNTVTFAVSGSGFSSTQCSEYPPSAFTTTVDVSNSALFSGTPSSVTSPSITTTLNHDFIYSHIGGFQNAGVFGYGSGYTGLGSVDGNDSSAAEFQIAGANGSYTSTFSNRTNTQGVIAIVALKSNSLTIRSPAVLPDGALTNAYNYTLVATGGVGSYTWSITAGSLQSGLSLNTSTGAITGTPTASSTNTITFHVTDGTNSANLTATLKVGGSLSTITLVQSISSATSGDAISLVFPSNVTAGNLIVAAGGYNGGSPSGSGAVQLCTDSRGTVFQHVVLTGFNSTTANVRQVDVLAGIAQSTGSDTVTCSSIRSIMEFSNAGYFGNENTVATVNTTATPITQALTTLVPNEAIVTIGAVYTSSGTLVLGSPFTALNTTLQDVVGYDVVTTATSYTASYTMASNTDGHWAIGLAGFRPGAGAVVITNSPTQIGATLTGP